MQLAGQDVFGVSFPPYVFTNKVTGRSRQTQWFSRNFLPFLAFSGRKKYMAYGIINDWHIEFARGYVRAYMQHVKIC